MIITLLNSPDYYHLIQAKLWDIYKKMPTKKTKTEIICSLSLGRQITAMTPWIYREICFTIFFPFIVSRWNHLSKLEYFE